MAGVGGGTLLHHGRLLWRNKHGRFVRRSVSISVPPADAPTREAHVSVCKRSSRPETTMPLPRGSVSVSSDKVAKSSNGDIIYPLSLAPSSGDALVLAFDSDELRR